MLQGRSHLSDRGRFPVSIASSKHEGELGEFSTVLQTRDAVKKLRSLSSDSSASLVLSNLPRAPWRNSAR